MLRWLLSLSLAVGFTTATAIAEEPPAKGDAPSVEAPPPEEAEESTSEEEATESEAQQGEEGSAPESPAQPD
jgi:hypothetical protein